MIRESEREIRRSYTFGFEDGGKVPKSRNAGGLYNLEKVRTNFYRVPKGQRSQASYSPWGCQELDTDDLALYIIPIMKGLNNKDRDPFQTSRLLISRTRR